MDLLFVYLVLFVLQGFLSAARKKYLGLILPAINILWSLVIFSNLLAIQDFSKGQLIFTSLLGLLICNLSTLFFVGIFYLVNKRKEKLQRDRLRALRKEALQG